MATISSNLESNQKRWQTIVCLTLGFWLSACIILDVVIMPSMYASGMMNTSDFTAAGSIMFSLFNRLELICASLGLTGLLVLSATPNNLIKNTKTAIIFSIALLAIALIDTYGLTPQMSALGINLNLFESVKEVPVTMNQMHGGYWLLEVIKLVVGGTLLGWCYQQKN
ncbi:MAG: DUF4149 domain-containing protein [Okeania sp. SIO2C2]|uniref:DUF4149 domain-containing protein n=1 Tax=Okeania hirsuta TaxID=1458930 RepID=A0A3N6PHN9_9CYAN|nr:MULTISPECIES: DUF4149 domain-containing protein [Okeania]NEP07894.1 DUF4149 domain-containing protein [Okeania sp. SIO4D6]NEP39777.1 DUF4149 domain-containing protein [Okeania sp. SIO2H7]NEP72969.1 DUF4149 domain-containing protein [Okeania sp. SIO2G5]NEP90343.1 DUF4149 domain-containing protein [Okeania sp. SIO2C2]NEP94956.1 DUF4149 domain-containing protein [Okeania sp. SIO2F5]